ncbi:MAG TPA: protein kinase [Chthoniobacterales bacterium]|jgi:serine/threonine-protein kinase
MTKSAAVGIGAEDKAVAMTREHGRTCAKCGAKIFADAADAPCPACLLETGLDRDADAAAPPIVRDFGDYEFIEEIGRGGQGIVYRARQKALNRIVALKVIALGPWATAAHLKRFRRGAEAAASLDHVNIVPIYEFGEREGCCYFSMKFVQGDRLDEWIACERMPIEKAATLVAKLARAVQHAHERKVLHCDIKPGNVLIDADGQPWLTDFGLARLTGADHDVTQTAEMAGTPSYMSPEQVESKPTTAATDVYGLGTVLYQLLTGQPPFAGTTSYETTRAVLESQPRPPRTFDSKVDRHLETICLKCLEKEPERRFDSAAALADDLERCLRHEPIQARTSSAISRGSKLLQRHRTFALLILIVTALAVALTITFLRQKTESSTIGIAVLPFQNLGDDKQDISFADGIQDDILTKLAKVGGLKVISRTSVMHFREERDVRKIGRLLGVSHVLEGSVRRAGARLRLNAQLIDARTDGHVWAEQYDRAVGDVFSIQSEIAQAIVGQLRATLSAPEKNALKNAPTRNVEAYDLYIQAKALTQISSPDNPRGLENLAKAAGLLEESVKHDPGFALAYCLLTDANLNLYWIPGRTDSSRRARADVALQVAQRLAPNAGETHLAQALFHYYGNKDYDRALEELETSASLLPNSDEVFRTRARIERRLGRWNEALRHFTRAIELDPREPTHLATVAQTYLILRHFNEAEQTADRGIALFPENVDEFWQLKGESALAQGEIQRGRAAMNSMSPTNSFPSFRFKVLFYERNYEDAERFSLALWQGKDSALTRYCAPWSAMAARARGDIEKAQAYFLAARQACEPTLREHPEDPRIQFEIGVIDAGLGKTEDAVRAIRAAVGLSLDPRDVLEGGDNSMLLAITYAWTGQRDRAIEQLSSAIKMPASINLGALKLDPIWDDLRDDPRFAQLLIEAAKPIPLQ